MGFHAPEEAARILGQATNLLRQAQILVRDPAFKPELPDAPHPGAGDAHAGPGTRGKTVGNPTGGTGGAGGTRGGGEGGTAH